MTPLKARQLMSTTVVTMPSDALLREAYRTMRSCGIRHLPVVDDERLVGMLSWGDVLLAAADVPGHGLAVPDLRTVADVMSRNVITCFPTTEIADVAATLVACKFDALPVVGSDGRLVGIVTTTDLLDVLCRDEDAHGAHVRPLDKASWTTEPRAT
jgi:CBS domain-containing protein